MKLGRLLLRLTLGGLFIGHGTQKLFGWFGGHGLENTGNFFESLGLRPGRHHALAAGVSEAGGGALILAGAATPLAAAAITGTMITAIQRVHLKNGPWSSNGGYEYNAVIIGAVLTLAEVGPGPLSIDGDRLHGPGWATLALLGGAAGAAGAHFYAAQQQAPTPPQEPAAPASNGASAEAEAAVTP